MIKIANPAMTARLSATQPLNSSKIIGLVKRHPWATLAATGVIALLGAGSIYCIIRLKSTPNASSANQPPPLCQAAKEGTPKQVEALIQNGSKVNVVEPIKKRSPLHLAVKSGNTDIVNLLLENHADVTVGDIDQQTPLHLAAKNGCTEIVRALIESGSEVNARDVGHRTPLHWAAWKGQAEVMNILLENGAYANAQTTQGWTPLHCAVVFSNDPATLDNRITALTREGGNVNATDNEGQTPLHWAAESMNASAIDMLILQGANVDAVDQEGRTYLDIASLAKKSLWDSLD